MEVRRNAGLKVFSLANIDDCSLMVAELIAARFLGQVQNYVFKLG